MTKEINQSKENKEVNHVADIIGEWGNWQRSLFIYLFLLDIIGALNNMGYSFYAFQVEFWCDDVPWDYKNKTDQMKCYKFTNSSEKCTKWNYDTSQFKSTIITEFDLVCDHSYLPSLTQTAYMCGYIFGGLLAFLSDKYGRRKMILISYTVNIIGIMSCAFSVNIYQYIFSRFLQSFGGSLGMGWEAFVVEATGPKHRANFVLFTAFGWIVGYCALPWIALGFGNFRYMTLSCAILLIFMALWFFFAFDESARWQLVHNKYDQAEKSIQKILIKNGKSIPDQDFKQKIKQLKQHIELITPKEEDKVNVLDILRTPKIRKYTLIFWFSIPVQAFIYYGISYNVGSYGGNYLVNFMLSGLVELPSQVACILGLKYFGRKPLTIFFLILVFISSLLMIPPQIRTISALFNKFAINSSWWIIYLLKRELYPTILRTTASGTIAIISRIGAIAAPFVEPIGNSIGHEYIFIFYAILTLITCGLIFMFPESRGREIPDSVYEIENYSKSKKQNQINPNHL